MPESQFKNRRILVVDDEERMVRFIRLNLEHDGFQVLEAFKGAQAIDRLRTGLPDLILLDVMLPDMNGLDLLRSIPSKTKKIVITGTQREEGMRRATSEGADVYLLKPVKPEKLLQLISLDCP